MKTIRLTVMLLAIVLLAACSGHPAAPATTTPAPTAATSGMGGMDHGSMMGDQPFDVMFIDGMIVHHEGAVTMAKQALAEAEHEEIRTLAEQIIAAQEREIAQMKAWRAEWYPDVEPTEGMPMDMMGTMEVSTDTSIPFDQRFIDAMIPHHEGAIMMAQMAQQQSEHEELKTLADEIITAQEGEIAQMKEWRAAWYGQ